MTAPKFICLGQQKAATDWVYDQFGSHRDFWKSPIKEIAYFDKGFGDRRREKAIRQIRWRLKHHLKKKGEYSNELDFLQVVLTSNPKPWRGEIAPYLSLFRNKPGLGFDCTPGYSRLGAKMITRLYGNLPDTRFFLTIRDPSDRLWSQAQMTVRNGWQTEEVTRDLSAFIEFAEHKHVRALSFASEALKHWRVIDTQGRFRQFSFDDLVWDAEKFRTDLCEFVGADPAGFSVDASHNKKSAQPGKRRMPPEFRAFAARHFKDEYAELRSLLGDVGARWHDASQEWIRQAA